MSEAAIKRWRHMRAAPFAEIADLLEQQDEALVRAGVQLKEGTQRLIDAASLCRTADAKIAQLLGVLATIQDELKNNPPSTESGKTVKALVDATMAKAAR